MITKNSYLQRLKKILKLLRNRNIPAAEKLLQEEIEAEIRKEEERREKVKN